ncbi:aminoglycoside 6-adenylyltransferase [Sporosarcina sp. Sa2YVA2]|uniref:Aminoglycoside 6-adenylyltransferase n=1 Tax=Sporosarcina quadrami TaxID=2762234 RepID=A0ABR8UCB1_9BACL|nr:aminoglycoside 6-adenylyltransferase [Sporosarcina quadrami]MBD7985660.1 aminoglycoside 6-adenylyltransferase [Sporosarcina quadrami]
MYDQEERNQYLNKMIEKIRTSEYVEGIVQIGSGVIGFTDEISDVDLMVASTEINNSQIAKDVIKGFFKELNPIYIKEKQFSKEIFLLIVILENKLEFNVSIVPRELLSVKSPLWKVVDDKTGLVTEKMIDENEKFENEPVKYEAGFDVPFEFVYCAIGVGKALKRNNLIYALGMLETMRTYTLYIQAMNENKKLHQFKAYDTLSPSFIQDFLKTYPEKINVESLGCVSKDLIRLFEAVLKKNSLYTMHDDLQRLLEKSFV